MTDELLLERLTAPFLGVEKLAEIPWPKGLAPVPASSVSGTPPSADVVVVTWTAAEAQALADVLTPGVSVDRWVPYSADFATLYEPHLTWKSPARSAKCQAKWWTTRIGSIDVVVVHSNLHLATDDKTAPVIELWKQLVQAIGPKLVITTGTAGGIGSQTELGDVFAVTNAKFNCTEGFRVQPWAQERFEGTPVPAGPHALLFGQLAGANAAQLRPVAQRDPVLVFGGDVETVDYFAFADTDDSYGVVRDDVLAHTEEMDDATLPLALSQLAGAVPEWCSVRCASDPEVPSSIGDLEAQKKWAAEIYTKYGYWAAVGSVIACWTVIADLS